MSAAHVGARRIDRSSRERVLGSSASSRSTSGRPARARARRSWLARHCGPRGRAAHRTQLARTASSGALRARVLRQVVRASTDAPVRPSARGEHHEFAARMSVARRVFLRACTASANDHILWSLRTTYQQFVEVLRICELVPRAQEMEGFQEASDVARSNNLCSHPSAAASKFVRQCVTGYDRRLAPSYGPATIAQEIGCYEQAGDDLLE